MHARGGHKYNNSEHACSCMFTLPAILLTPLPAENQEGLHPTYLMS